MISVKPRMVQGLALALVAVAVPFALWLSRPLVNERSLDGPRRGGLPISHEPGASGEQVTYRFLYRGEAGAIENRLTLGCFVDDDLRRGATWGFAGRDNWLTWAPDVFARERRWVAEDQPGWQISRWLSADPSVACDSTLLFWAIQALRLLDPESLANEIDMIERSGGAVRICPTRGPSDYDYQTNTLYWNPTATEYVPEDDRLDWKWFRTDPLIALSHELNHVWHDLCRHGDAADDRQREQMAVAAENRIRHILFLKDPYCTHIYPRPGHLETWPDLPGASAQQAWQDYRGAVEY